MKQILNLAVLSVLFLGACTTAPKPLLDVTKDTNKIFAEMEKNFPKADSVWQNVAKEDTDGQQVTTRTYVYTGDKGAYVSATVTTTKADEAEGTVKTVSAEYSAIPGTKVAASAYATHTGLTDDEAGKLNLYLVDQNKTVAGSASGPAVAAKAAPEKQEMFIGSIVDGDKLYGVSGVYVSDTSITLGKAEMTDYKKI